MRPKARYGRKTVRTLRLSAIQGSRRVAAQPCSAPSTSRALKLRLALYQPDIAANLGASIRIAACFGAPLEIIEPCGFLLTDRSLKRTALDYAPQAILIRHASWSAFLADPARQAGRLVLFTTKGATSLTAFSFVHGDTLLFGRESAGAPKEVHEAAEARVVIPIQGRSLNVAVSAGIALFEAKRQLA
jgi:tRNA (cytidine/uridine-2'-O-)-methyltransferase